LMWLTCPSAKTLFTDGIKVTLNDCRWFPWQGGCFAACVSFSRQKQKSFPLGSVVCAGPRGWLLIRGGAQADNRLRCSADATKTCELLLWTQAPRFRLADEKNGSSKKCVKCAVLSQYKSFFFDCTH
jgi:hypothetical protein